MLMLIYYFTAFIAKQDLQTVASTCVFFSILAYLSSVLFIMKPTQMKRDIYYVLLFHSA